MGINFYQLAAIFLTILVAEFIAAKFKTKINSTLLAVGIQEPATVYDYVRIHYPNAT